MEVVEVIDSAQQFSRSQSLVLGTDSTTLVSSPNPLNQGKAISVQVFCWQRRHITKFHWPWDASKHASALKIGLQGIVDPYLPCHLHLFQPGSESVVEIHGELPLHTQASGPSPADERAHSHGDTGFCLPSPGAWGPLLHPQKLTLLADPYLFPEAPDLLTLLPWAPHPGASHLT